MYFIKYRHLAEELRDGTVTQRETFLYLIVLLGFYASSYEFLYIGTATDPKTLTFWDYGISISYVVMTLIGATLAYHANRAGDNQHFIERFICLAFPATMRIVLLTTAIYVAIAYSPEHVYQSQQAAPYATSGLDFAINIAITLYFYYVIYQGITIASASHPTLQEHSHG